jgi:hypothetical protein
MDSGLAQSAPRSDSGGFAIVLCERATRSGDLMSDEQSHNQKGPNVKKKQKCKNCEGKGLLKKGDKVVKCQRCKGTGLR